MPKACFQHDARRCVRLGAVTPRRARVPPVDFGDDLAAVQERHMQALRKLRTLRSAEHPTALVHTAPLPVISNRNRWSP